MGKWTGGAMAGGVDPGRMPACSDCAYYTPGGDDPSGCPMAGPVSADRDAPRCHVRLFVPKPAR